MLHKLQSEHLPRTPLRSRLRSLRAVVRTHLQRFMSSNSKRGSNSSPQSTIRETTSDYDRDKLQERVAKLAGGVAVIRVGGATEVEVKERKDRVDDACDSRRRGRRNPARRLCGPAPGDEGGRET